MKKIIKIYYKFDQEERKNFKKWLVDQELTRKEFAKKLKISVPYLDMLIHGKRNFTPELIQRFEKIGYKFNTIKG